MVVALIDSLVTGYLFEHPDVIQPALALQTIHDVYDDQTEIFLSAQENINGKYSWLNLNYLARSSFFLTSVPN